jgi:hypothetical protein
MELTEQQVVEAVACPHPGCKAQPGRSCRHHGGPSNGATRTHRGRWLKMKRALLTGRVALPSH